MGNQNKDTSIRESQCFWYFCGQNDAKTVQRRCAVGWGPVKWIYGCMCRTKTLYFCRVKCVGDGSGRSSHLFERKKNHEVLKNQMIIEAECTVYTHFQASAFSGSSLTAASNANIASVSLPSFIRRSPRSNGLFSSKNDTWLFEWIRAVSSRITIKSFVCNTTVKAQLATHDTSMCLLTSSISSSLAHSLHNAHTARVPIHAWRIWITQKFSAVCSREFRQKLKTYSEFKRSQTNTHQQMDSAPQTCTPDLPQF